MGEKAVRAESEQRNAESKGTDTARTETGTRTGAGTGTRTETKEKPVEISVVDQQEPVKIGIPNGDALNEEQKRAEKNARRREQYAKKKAESGGTVRTRKKAAPTKADNKQLNLLIATLSGLVASRPGCEHWLLSESEINSITEPLANIIAENESLKAMSEHTDAIALAMACFTVFVPRLMISAKKAKERKEKDVTGNSVNTNVKSESGKSKGVSAGNDKKSSGTSVDHGTNLSWLADAVY